MGYISTAEGTLRFEPSLTEDLAAEAIDFVNKAVPYAYWVGEQLESGDTWHAWFDGKLYSLDRELIALAGFLKSKGVVMNGTVTGSGEDAVDIWRIVVKDGEAVKEMAEIRWPDGTKVDVI